MEQELITLGILFGFALVGSILAARFKQPMLMGLLLVGALIGPNMFGIINDAHVMDMMIEFGAVLILFVLGLEFDITRLKKLGLKPVLLATFNVLFMTFAGFGVSLLLGFGVKAALFFGLILSFGSTVIIAKVLENKGMMNREEVPLIIAVLIVDDIIAVMIVTFLSGIEDTSIGLVGSIEGLIISIFVLVLIYVLFIKFIKPALSWILAKYDAEEIRVFAALSIWAGFAYLAYYLNLSPAVGAFMAGSIVTSLPNTKGLKESIEPYNLLTSSFFFIAIGTLVSFTAILDNIMLILTLVGIVIIMKLTVYSMMTYMFANMKGENMFFLSVATFAVGEFSLLIAKQSMKFNIGVDLISIAAAVISISAVIMSLTITHSHQIYQPAVERLPWKMRKKIEKFSDYLKAVSEELDVDTKHSLALKKNLTKAFISIIGILLLIFSWRKATEYLQVMGYSYVLDLGYIITLFFIAILLFYMLFTLKKMITTLGDIFENATNTRSTVHSRIIVQKAFIGFTLFTIGLFWPFIMFVVNMNGWYMIVSLVFMAIAIWEFRNISLLMSDNLDATRYSCPSYSKIKYDNDSKEVNKGWKF